MTTFEPLNGCLNGPRCASTTAASKVNDSHQPTSGDSIPPWVRGALSSCFLGALLFCGPSARTANASGSLFLTDCRPFVSTAGLTRNGTATRSEHGGRGVDMLETARPTQSYHAPAWAGRSENKDVNLHTSRTEAAFHWTFRPRRCQLATFRGRVFRGFTPSSFFPTIPDNFLS